MKTILVDLMNGRKGVPAKKQTPSRLASRYIRAMAAGTASALVLLTTSAFAKGPGTTTGELLKIPVDARAIGMGEAFTAAADDSYALQWNPAGLAVASQKEASFMHQNLIESIHYEHLSFMSPGDHWSAGASMSYLGYGDIAGYDNNAQPIGNQSANSYIFTGGAATHIREGLAIGAAASVLREKLADTSASTFAGNIGALYSFQNHPLGGDYRLGVSALNIGPGLKYISERDPLPRKIKFGAAAMHVKDWPLNLTMDVTMPNDNGNYVSLGSEYWFRNLLALRLGYIGSNDEGKGLRLGLGLKMRGFLFDYAYGGFGDFGATHRIGLTLRWGEKMKQLTKEERMVLKEARLRIQTGDIGPGILMLNDLLEKDPNNDRILKELVRANDAMLKQELNEAVAKARTDTGAEPSQLPSPEEMVLRELVPGQEKLAQPSGQFRPDDPLDLSTLPDIENLSEVASVRDRLQEQVHSEPALKDAPRPDTPVQPVEAITPAAQPAASDSTGGAAINPNDIYGN